MVMQMGECAPGWRMRDGRIVRPDLCPRAHQHGRVNQTPGPALGLSEVREDLLERGDDFVPLGLAFPETQFEREVLVVRTVVERERFRSARLWLCGRPAH